MQKIYSDTDLDNIPFSETIYSHGGVASNRPLLMIEPSYKINGEDKTRTQNRSVRASGEQDSKSTARTTPDTKGDATSGPEYKARDKPTSDTKADAKIGETPNSDTKEDPKVAAAASLPDPKEGENAVVKPASKPVSKTDSKSDAKVVPSVSDSSTQKMSGGKQPKSSSSGNVMHKSNIPLVSSSESRVDKSGGLPTTRSRLEGERMPSPVGQPPTSRPILEDNIVLGVALEGSKRTLPIDEGMATPASHGEGKEMAASRNGNGTSNPEKDKKDGEVPTAPSSTSGTQ